MDMSKEQQSQAIMEYMDSSMNQGKQVEALQKMKEDAELKELEDVRKAEEKENIGGIIGNAARGAFGIVSSAFKGANTMLNAAGEGLTVSLAAEFAPNIRVNCVAPSLTKSKIAEPMLKNNLIAEAIAKAHPLKRLGEGKDSAALAKFLITEESSWVTGQIIAVDGGRSKLS